MKIFKKMGSYWEVGLIALAGVITILLSIKSILKENAKDKEFVSQTKELSTIKDQLLIAREELKERSDSTLNFLTGGNSYPIFRLELDKGTAHILIEVVGTNPIYNLNYRIMREKDFKDINPEIGFSMSEAHKRIFFQGQMDFLFPATHNGSGASFPIPEDMTEDENFFVHALGRNGEFHQKCGFRIKDGKIFRATIVVKGAKEDLLFKHIDEGFLRPAENFTYRKTKK